MEARVLLVTFGSVLQPRAGLPVRARAVTEALAELGVHVTVVSNWEPSRVLMDPTPIWRLVVLKGPLRLGFSFELMSTCRELLNEVDAVVVESALLFPAVALCNPRVPLIWDTNECETLHYARLPRTVGNRLRGSVWRQIEGWASRRSEIVVAISDMEATWWSRLFPGIKRKLRVANHTMLPRTASHRGWRARLGINDGGPLLLFVGNLLAKHNVTAAKWILGQLAPSLGPKYTIVLAGPGTERLVSWKRHDATVRCLGEVRDIDSLIADADVCLAPLAAGAGVKTKVLHYLAHGKRVIGTPLAFEGLEDAPGIHATPLEHLAESIIAETQHEETDLARAAREKAQVSWVDRRYGRRLSVAHWRSILQDVGITRS